VKILNFNCTFCCHFLVSVTNEHHFSNLVRYPDFRFDSNCLDIKDAKMCDMFIAFAVGEFTSVK